MGQLDIGEINFVTVKGDDISYYQVSATALGENTLKGELAPFKEANGNYPKYLLTLDEIFGVADYEGIKRLNILEWLLNG